MGYENIDITGYGPWNVEYNDMLVSIWPEMERGVMRGERLVISRLDEEIIFPTCINAVTRISRQGFRVAFSPVYRPEDHPDDAPPPQPSIETADIVYEYQGRREVDAVERHRLLSLIGRALIIRSEEQ